MDSLGRGRTQLITTKEDTFVLDFVGGLQPAGEQRAVSMVATEAVSAGQDIPTYSPRRSSAALFARIVHWPARCPPTGFSPADAV